MGEDVEEGMVKGVGGKLIEEGCEELVKDLGK